MITKAVSVGWCFLVVCVLGRAPKVNDPFSDPDGAITELTFENFNRVVFNASNAWVIEFYVKTCGHCIAYAKHYAELASSTRRWRPVIALSRIECRSDRRNANICQRFGVRQYPTVVFFPTGGTSGSVGPDVYVTVKNLTAKSKHEVMDEMVDYVSSADANLCRSWPDFSLISNLGMKKARNYLTQKTQSLVVILEGKDSYDGGYLILNTASWRKYVVVVRGDIKTSKFGVDKSKHSVLIIGTEVHYDCTEKELLDLVRNYLASINPHFVDTSTTITTGHTKPPAGTTTITNSTDIQEVVEPGKMYAQDIENAVYDIFFIELATVTSFNRSEVRVLRRFVYSLARYLPSTMDNARLLLAEVHMWLMRKSRSTKFTYAQLNHTLHRLQVRYEHPLQARGWMGCRGSAPNLRGYSCGLWTMFHTLTVNHYKSRCNHFRRSTVLMSIRGFILNFFTCQDCVQHFGRLSTKLQREVVNDDWSVLWLWWAHNKVNKRLVKAPAEDPKHPKKQFPTADLCAECKNKRGLWNYRKVLNFLLDFYIPIPTKTQCSSSETKTDTDSQEADDGHVDNQDSSQGESSKQKGRGKKESFKYVEVGGSGSKVKTEFGGKRTSKKNKVKKGTTKKSGTGSKVELTESDFEEHKESGEQESSKKTKNNKKGRTKKPESGSKVEMELIGSGFEEHKESIEQEKSKKIKYAYIGRPKKPESSSKVEMELTGSDSEEHKESPEQESSKKNKTANKGRRTKKPESSSKMEMELTGSGSEEHKEIGEQGSSKKYKNVYKGRTKKPESSSKVEMELTGSGFEEHKEIGEQGSSKNYKNTNKRRTRKPESSRKVEKEIAGSGSENPTGDSEQESSKQKEKGQKESSKVVKMSSSSGSSSNSGKIETSENGFEEQIFGSPNIHLENSESSSQSKSSQSKGSSHHSGTYDSVLGDTSYEEIDGGDHSDKSTVYQIDDINEDNHPQGYKMKKWKTENVVHEGPKKTHQMFYELPVNTWKVHKNYHNELRQRRDLASYTEIKQTALMTFRILPTIACLFMAMVLVPVCFMYAYSQCRKGTKPLNSSARYLSY